MGRISHIEPGAVGAIQVNTDVRECLQRIYCIVQHKEAVCCSGCWIRLSRLAPLLDAIDRRVPRDDAQAIGLEDHNGLLVADTSREAIDPSQICIDGCCATCTELGAIAEWDVVSNQDRNGTLIGGALNRVPNILEHALWSALCEPDCLWSVDHLFN